MSSLAMQFSVTVNGRLYTQDRPMAHPAMSVLAMFGQQPEARPMVLDTAAEAEQVAARIREHLSDQFGLTPIVQVVHRYCTDWMGGDPAEGLAAAVQRYLDDGGDAL